MIGIIPSIGWVCLRRGAMRQADRARAGSPGAETARLSSRLTAHLTMCCFILIAGSSTFFLFG
jgi:hypothetical protein